MSVRQSERGEGKLEVLDCANKLAVYTLNICKSDKVFPKSQRWLLPKRMVDECVSAIICIKRANATKLDDTNAFNRYMLQEEAYTHLEALLALIDLSLNVFNVPFRKIEFWTKLVVNTEIKLKAWEKSDKQRLG